MIKKKAKSKAAAKKPAKKKSEAKAKPETNPAEVRKEISKLVEEAAAEVAEAVIDVAKTGQLAPAKYLFEMAKIFPAGENGEQAKPEEDCLAKMLLDRIGPPPKKEEEGEAASGIGADPTASTGSGQALAAKNAATIGPAAPIGSPAKGEDGAAGKNPEREDAPKEVLVTG